MIAVQAFKVMLGPLEVMFGVAGKEPNGCGGTGNSPTMGADPLVVVHTTNVFDACWLPGAVTLICSGARDCTGMVNAPTTTLPLRVKVCVPSTVDPASDDPVASRRRR